MLGHVSLGDETTLLRFEPRQRRGGDSDIANCQRFSRESLAFIQHSAGTTGLQKGVALTHAAVLRQIEHLAEALQIDGTRTTFTAGCRFTTTWD